MLHELLEAYLANIDTVLRTLVKTYVEKYETEILSAERINNTFPHHKHMSDNVIGCNKPNAADAIAEAVKVCGC